MDPTFSFSAELWPWRTETSTTCVMLTVPTDISDEIADLVPDRRGFGSIKVRARIGPSEWSSSIFPSKELGSFVLPLNKAVRKANDVESGDVVDVELDILIT